MSSLPFSRFNRLSPFFCFVLPDAKEQRFGTLISEPAILYTLTSVFFETDFLRLFLAIVRLSLSVRFHLKNLFEIRTNEEEIMTGEADRTRATSLSVDN